MLFNSYVFIFLFLPATLLCFALVRRRLSQRNALLFLVLASLVYYGYWHAPYLLILVASIAVNYGIATVIIVRPAPRLRTTAFVLGLVFNLGLLGYYKYSGFFVATADSLAGFGLTVPEIVLPIGISFFTFQQIALLADARAGKVARLSPLDHAFFITFFPQLIAGPIVHHAEIFPQLERPRSAPWSRDLAIGLAIFTVGLFKKVVIADSVAIYADAGFGMVADGGAIDPASAWIAALSYAFQIYFDFSGYSDMAVGLARMFGVVLPVNFYSPYRAAGFADFWRRWHITLSRFLRDYLYIPLGGNRHGLARQFLALATVMALGGLWHGAGWTFVLWGVLHGLLLILDHGWNRLPFSRRAAFRSRGARAVVILLTFAVVTMVWVPFRAGSLAETLAFWGAMFPLDPEEARKSLAGFLQAHFLSLDRRAVWAEFFAPRALWPPVLPADYLATRALPAGPLLALLALLCFFWPNTYQLFRAYAPALHLPPATGAGLRFLDRPRLRWLAALILAAMFVISLLSLSDVSPFLYFQF